MPLFTWFRIFLEMRKVFNPVLISVKYMARYYIRKEYFKIVPLEEIKAYVDNAKTMDVKVLIALVWLTGLRILEVVNLIRDNFILDEERKELTMPVQVLKHGTIAYPSFNADDPFVFDLVVPFIKTKQNKIFNCGKRMYELRLKELNERLHGNDTAKWITFHYLRHSRISYITRILRASPEQVKSWTGHNSSAFETYFRSRRVEEFRGKIR